MSFKLKVSPRDKKIDIGTAGWKQRFVGVLAAKTSEDQRSLMSIYNVAPGGFYE